MRRFTREAGLWLLTIPILLWTLLPIYHIFLFSISSKDSAFSGALWPDKPTLRNFGTIVREEHFYLHHFWVQIWNSLWIAVAVGALTLATATCAAFAISRLKVKGGRTVMNLALFTYFIPAAFLAIPMYKAMGAYALLLAWNEYLYGYLLLSHEQTIPLAVALGHFIAADDSPWELLMATGLVYALPPAAIYYAFRRYMVGGLTAGAVKI